MRDATEPSRSRVLVLAPTGRDAALTVEVLANAGIEASVCLSVAELAAEIERGAGAALVAEEALEGMDVSALVSALDAQPSWSDLPLLMMTNDESGVERILATLAASANVTILQRPTRIAMLISVVRAALRSRVRQYETQDLLEQLREADRQKDAFLTTISHELRTPLNAILGWTAIMRAEHCDAASHVRGLEVLDRNAEAQATIIEDLLDVSRIITGKVRLEIRPVDLMQVVLAAVESVRPGADSRSITIEAPAPPCPVQVSGDPDRLQQIAWNLLSNAVKFTPAGGRVEVEVGSADGWAFLRVADTGAGIAPEFLPHLFKRFQQADSSTTRRHGGLGIGLAIVRHLAELHGGSVRAESTGEGRGATFEVRLPRWEGAARGEEAQADSRAVEETPRAQESPLDGVRVLVVDDNADSIELIRTLLKSFGAEVRGADSAETGLAEVRGWRPDVLLSDIAMPGLDGFWLIEHVRALGADEGGNTPAVAMTAFAERDDRTRAIRAGFEFHLRKPLALDELTAVVASLAGRPTRPSAISPGQPASEPRV